MKLSSLLVLLALLAPLALSVARAEDAPAAAPANDRVEQTVLRGSLNGKILSQMQTQEALLAATERQVVATDGKLTEAHTKPIKQAVRDVAAAIWGNAKNSDRSNIGITVEWRRQVARQLSTNELGKSEARALAHDFGQMLDLRTKLATKDLTDDERKDVQAQYNDLLSKYFVPIAAPAAK